MTGERERERERKREREREREREGERARERDSDAMREYSHRVRILKAAPGAEQANQNAIYSLTIHVFWFSSWL